MKPADRLQPVLIALLILACALGSPEKCAGCSCDRFRHVIFSETCRAHHLQKLHVSSGLGHSSVGVGGCKSTHLPGPFGYNRLWAPQAHLSKPIDNKTSGCNVWVLGCLSIHALCRCGRHIWYFKIGLTVASGLPSSSKGKQEPPN